MLPLNFRYRIMFRAVTTNLLILTEYFNACESRDKILDPNIKKYEFQQIHILFHKNFAY